MIVLRFLRSRSFVSGNALIHGAIETILEKTPQVFFDETIKVVEVRIVRLLRKLSRKAAVGFFRIFGDRREENSATLNLVADDESLSARCSIFFARQRCNFERHVELKRGLWKG